MGRMPTAIILDEDQKKTLEHWRRRSNTKAGLHLRAGIILDCVRGDESRDIARTHGVSRQTVSKWRNRFARLGLAGLSDAPRLGQPRKHGDEKVQAVLEATLRSQPKAATHWSVRGLSRELGLPRDFIHRVWHAFGLKPHLSKSFKLSSDPHFTEKVKSLLSKIIRHHPEFPAFPWGRPVQRRFFRTRSALCPIISFAAVQIRAAKDAVVRLLSLPPAPTAARRVP